MTSCENDGYSTTQEALNAETSRTSHISKYGFVTKTNNKIV